MQTTRLSRPALAVGAAGAGAVATVGPAYTYDWIENLLGLAMHSADEILPRYQNLRVGDELPMGPGRPGMTVEVLDPSRTLADRLADQNWVRIFAGAASGRMARSGRRRRTVRQWPRRASSRH
jgi:hypothetical protein